MAFTVKKVDGELVFKDHGGYETRNPSTIWCIREADAVYGWPDFPEIKICTGDQERSADEFTYSKKNSYRRLVPDFNFHAWPQVGIDDYATFTEQIGAAGCCVPEINKVGWIGNTNTHVNRKKLLNIAQENPELFDIFDMRWKRSGRIFLDSTQYIHTADLVKKYSILIDIEGAGYSGRLKHLLWSRRPLLLVDRPHKEFFFEHLVEWKHYIPVKRDLSDIIEKTRWCMENYENAKEIASCAYEFSKGHLTRDACFEQWDNIINELMHARI
jgi:hypothetical protein